MINLMRQLRVYHFSFDVCATEMISFGVQPGAQLRGAIYNALSQHFCSERGFEHIPGHQSRCPVCWLLATEAPDNDRGRDLPRPFILNPPLKEQVIQRGEMFSFGVTLIGDAVKTFPYLIRAVETVGCDGVGRGRGRFSIQAISAVNPLTSETISLLDGKQFTGIPDVPITNDQVKVAATYLPHDRVTLRFLTPLRIGENDRLAREPHLGVLLRRLVDRCQVMVEYFSGNATPADRNVWKMTQEHLGDLGNQAHLIANRTHWLDVHSGSRRRGTTSPIGGLVGSATWTGNLKDVIPWLLWGQSLHVGKSTVKGNGWFLIERQ